MCRGSRHSSIRRDRSFVQTVRVQHHGAHGTTFHTRLNVLGETVTRCQRKWSYRDLTSHPCCSHGCWNSERSTAIYIQRCGRGLSTVDKYLHVKLACRLLASMMIPRAEKRHARGDGFPAGLSIIRSKFSSKHVGNHPTVRRFAARSQKRRCSVRAPEDLFRDTLAKAEDVLDTHPSICRNRDLSVGIA